MAGYIERTIAAYDQSPDKYFESTREMTPPQEFSCFVATVKGLGTRILDAGCAFGRDTSAFHEAGLDVTGIDLSDGLLQKARDLHPELDFRKMDIRSLEFADATFDGIWCHTVLLHLNDEDLERALNEFHRVLKPTGTLFISFKKGEGTQEVLETFSSNAARFYNFKTIEPLTATLREAGFTDINAYYINEQEMFGPEKRDLDWVYCFSTRDVSA